ncbi:ABC transporter substrate-binding protein [Clostridium grantii]|uniref:Carbohydrate ABC transporter substrate-binding protein, CUT1 family n=1 Tax=Clostridium grantii DSM 8605 TaxID=1121316 RepID=A0A1M5TLT8_9CLOT|nr:extracellular solute-binding protein [Clostridium grantii]SHH51742.1 carbohydrate ABC transporter substrate-binding protein, CUT1 family [Clostridium grantii DSM 8605]
MKRKFIKSTIAMMLATGMLILVGCSGNDGSNTSNSGNETSGEKVKLSFAVNFTQTEVTYKNLEEIVANFENENPNIDIELANLPDYEATMKTKMAANDLPDLWTTHGWSVARYSEYLLPLTDQPWVSKIDSLIKPVITNGDGDIFVLPMDYDVAGVAFNKTVLDEAGVDPFAIKTWDDFKAACEKVKAAGKTPLYVGGAKDDWTVGNFFDWVAPSFLITNEAKNYRAELKDGSFDWNNYKPAAQLFADLLDAGYVNKNVAEGTWPEVGEQLAKGEAAFAFFGNYVIGEAQKFNAEGDYGFIPVPAASADDEPTVITGERTTVGVWKDSKHQAEALKFVEYLAQSENINKVATGNLAPTGLSGEGYSSDTGNLAPYFENATKFRGFGYFDREYLPNGMWDSLCKTGTGIISKTMTMDDVVSKLKEDYDRLRTQ